MKALRWMVLGLTMAMGACVARPMAPPTDRPPIVAPIQNVDAKPIEHTADATMSPVASVELDEEALAAAQPIHDAFYARALKNIDRDELALAADELEAAAKSLDDAVGGFHGNPPRVIRFDREMARRLREVAANGGGGKLLVDRIAAFDTSEPDERKLVVATAKLAQSKLLHDYRTKPAPEAALAARVFFKTVWIMQIYHPPVCKEMLRRFPFELRGGGHYEPPPFYLESDPRVI